MSSRVQPTSVSCVIKYAQDYTGEGVELIDRLIVMWRTINRNATMD